MADQPIVVDASQVHSITVDPSELQAAPAHVVKSTFKGPKQQMTPEDEAQVANFGQNATGSIGDYLTTAARVLGAPVTGLLHAPVELIDWIRHGGRNPTMEQGGMPGGTLGEEPVSQMVGAIPGAFLPPDLAAGREGVGRATTAVKGAITKPGTAQTLTGAGQLAGAPAAAMAGHPFVAGGLFLRGLENLKKGSAARAAIAAAGSELEEGLSQSMLQKSFDKAGEAERASIKQVANRIQNGLSTEETAPAAPRPGRINTGEALPATRGLADMLRDELGMKKSLANIPENISTKSSTVLERLKALRQRADELGYEKGAELPPDYQPPKAELVPKQADKMTPRAAFLAQQLAEEMRKSGTIEK